MISFSAITKKISGISLRLFIVLFVFVVILAVFLAITNEFVLEKENAFDDRVFAILQTCTSPSVTKMMNFFTFFGSTLFLFPAYGLLVLFYTFFRKNNWRSFNIAAIGISSITLLLVIKNIFRRHRPPHPLVEASGFSYPSGHSTSAFTFAGVLIYILWQSGISKTYKWTGTIAFTLFACMVAISRVYLHVHYASDVAAGFCLAFLWLTICLFILRFIHKKFDKKGAGSE